MDRISRDIHRASPRELLMAQHTVLLLVQKLLVYMEVAKYHIKPAFAHGAEGDWFVNKKAFEKLPKDIQNVLIEVLEEQFYERAISHAIEETIALSNAVRNQNVTVLYLPETDQNIMIQEAQKLWDEIAESSPSAKEGIKLLREYMKLLGRL